MSKRMHSVSDSPRHPDRDTCRLPPPGQRPMKKKLSELPEMDRLIPSRSSPNCTFPLVILVMLYTHKVLAQSVVSVYKMEKGKANNQ